MSRVLIFDHGTLTVAGVVNVFTNDHSQFITKNVHLCMQHDGREEQRRVGSSARAETRTQA